MTTTDWSLDDWRSVLVYGLGLSGRAAARLLAAHGVRVVGVDDSPRGSDAAAEGPEMELHYGSEVPAEPPPGVDAIVLSPGVPPDRPLLAAARRRGLPILAEVELAFPFADGPVVGITGSNGKSTTTALTGALLEAAGRAVEVCGNIGRPLADAVAGPPGRVFVVELSSFQLEGIQRFKPRAAAYLNLSPDHLDRYPSLDAYDAAKRRLFERMDGGDVAVLNRDDPRTAAVDTTARRRFFSRRHEVADGCHLDGGRVIEISPEGASELFSRDDLPLPGEHNLENAMAAALLARALGAPPAAIRQGLRRFTGLPHRMQKVSERRGVTWYDDSKGTNPAATARSLEGLAPGSVHLILGGRNKGADFAELAPQVGEKACRVYLIGEAAGQIEAALAHSVPMEHAGTLERAVAAAAGRARPGEVVLLSPACASFDQFANFIERGQRFQALVRALGEGPGGQEAGV